MIKEFVHIGGSLLIDLRIIKAILTKPCKGPDNLVNLYIYLDGGEILQSPFDSGAISFGVEEADALISEWEEFNNV